MKKEEGYHLLLRLYFVISVMAFISIMIVCRVIMAKSTEDITVVNVSPGIIHDRQVGVFSVTNISCTYDGSLSTLICTIENTSEQAVSLKNFTLILQDEKGKDILTMLGYVGEYVDKGEVRTITSSTDMNLSEATALIMYYTNIEGVVIWEDGITPPIPSPSVSPNIPSISPMVSVLPASTSPSSASPTVVPSIIPSTSPIVMPSESPSTSPIVIPSESPSTSPSDESTLAPSNTPPIISPINPSTMLPSQGNENTIFEKTLQINHFRLSKGDIPCLIWQRVKKAAYIEVFRSKKINSGYKRIRRVSSSKNRMKDKNIKKGETYYYKIRAVYHDKVGDFSNTLKKSIPLLSRPVISVKSMYDNKTDISWLKLSLVKYDGRYIEIFYRKGIRKFHKVKIKNTKISKKVFKIRYKPDSEDIYIRVRTYIIKKGKVHHSKFSKITKVKD
jgi:hypothetical protein